MSSEKDLLSIMNDLHNDLPYRSYATLLLQELRLRKIVGRLDLLAAIFVFVLLLQACSLIGLL
jgi:hypothetical protein